MIDTVKLRLTLSSRLVKLLCGSKWGGKRVAGNFQGMTYRIRPANEFTELVMEASLPKLVQGHNAAGTNRLDNLCSEVIEMLIRSADDALSPQDKRAIRRASITPARVDVVGSFHVGSQSNVGALMGEVRRQLLAAGHDIVVHEGPGGIETIYVGKNSRRATIKFYNKFAELQEKGFPEDFHHEDAILDFARDVIRFELTLRSRELQRLGLAGVEAWNRDRTKGLLSERIAKFGFTGQLKDALDVTQLDRVSPRLKTVLGLWRDGADLRRHMPKHTFRRIRRRLLKEGIDIGRPAGEPRPTRSLKKLLSPARLRVGYPRRLAEIGGVYRRREG